MQHRRLGVRVRRFARGGVVIPLLIDEHLSQALTDALTARGIDAVRVQDVGLDGTPDPDILAWAATCGRVFVTLDRKTVPGFAYARVRAGLPMAGVALVDDTRSFGDVVESLELFAACETAVTMRDRVEFIPY